MMEPIVWERIGALADRAPTPADLMHHRLQLVAGARTRARGEEPPERVYRDERRFAAAYVSAPMLLARIRSIVDGRLVLIKGPEAAARWPDPRLRPLQDLDLLADDAPAAHAALMAAGFVALADPASYADYHHLVPLALPGMPLTLDIHERLHWPTEAPPSFEEIFEAAVTAAPSIGGLLAPSSAHHAVILAGHAWAHEPLGRIGSLADIAAVAEEAEPGAAAAVARAWGVSHIWTTSARAVDELLYERPSSVHRPVWTRHLRSARERTVFESHVARFSGSMAAVPRRKTPLALLRVLRGTLRRNDDEGWRGKLRRTLRAARNASAPKSWHEAES
jgi:hypothetical protein